MDGINIVMESVKKVADLVSTKEAISSGFAWQADEKVERAESYFEHANYFLEKAPTITSIDDIRNDPILTEFMLAACMFSKKSLSHLNIEIQNEVIAKLVDFSELHDPDYLKLLERRYFLTSGDALGGTMRNVIGQLAQTKLSEGIFQYLVGIGASPEKIVNKSGKITAIVWRDRRIIFDKKPAFIDKSIDFIVVKGESAKTGVIETPEDYLCCGELKGGVDPAGADEHWKTARSALERIAVKFERQGLNKPKLIFIGAAIENSMAAEIFRLLQSGWLAGAANLMQESQLAEVIEIITA